MKTELLIEGMTCASCANHVEKSLLKVPGVSVAQVNLATKKARVEAQTKVPITALIDAVNIAGYDAKEAAPRNSKTQPAQSATQTRGIEVALAIILSLPLLSSHFVPSISLDWRIQLALASVVQFALGRRFYISGSKALIHRHANMDVLVSIGTLASFGLSTYLGSQQAHHLYFESGATVITLVLLGKWMEDQAKRRTLAAIEALEALQPETAMIRKNGQDIEVKISELLPNDFVVVRPGDRVPIDGVITEGTSHVDESWVSGESLPLAKGPGDRVSTGSVNQDGVILVQAQRVGDETLLSQVIRRVQDAQGEKAPIQRKVDQISAIFVPTILIISLVTLLCWGFINSDWSVALLNSVAVLVIACPCALGLATPTAILVGTGVAARSGILIKDPESLEIAHSLNTIVFDKTGTLTEGHPSVTTIYPIEITESELLRIAASIQANSSHPLAQATITEAKKRKISIPIAQSIQAIPGRGASGTLDHENYLIGNEALMNEKQVPLATHGDLLQKVKEQDASLSFIAKKSSSDWTWLGALAYQDTIKTSSPAAVLRLKEMGINCVLLTGDRESIAKKIAHEVGITQVFSETNPEGKANVIQELKNNGSRVAMVGDGINDALALAAADVGIALSTGTDVAMHSAGITLMRGDPALIASAIEISRLTYRKIQQNLFWAMVYNLIGVPLAALGYLNPIIAGAAMALSSVSVVSNSLTLNRWKPLKK